MFFKIWYGILCILIVGPLAYVFLIILLRVSGKRTDTVGEFGSLTRPAALGWISA